MIKERVIRPYLGGTVEFRPEEQYKNRDGLMKTSEPGIYIVDGASKFPRKVPIQALKTIIKAGESKELKGFIDELEKIELGNC